MKQPLILLTTSTEQMDNTPIVRLNHEYVNAVIGAGGVPVPLVSTAGLEKLAAMADGLLLTGGVDVNPACFHEEPVNDTVHWDAARDALELALLKTYLPTGKPILAICRGIQVLNVAFGGSLIQDIPSWCGANHTAVDHTVRVAPGSMLHRLMGKEELAVNSFHHQCVVPEGMAPGFVATALWRGSGVTVVEAMERPGYPLLAVQWHPERAYRDPAGLTDMGPLFRWLVEKARG